LDHDNHRRRRKEHNTSIDSTTLHATNTDRKPEYDTHGKSEHDPNEQHWQTLQFDPSNADTLEEILGF